ncbi:hypothetical protein M405DRAFT_483807 [Rhizopogon salebrosus TDB-379]|nr:hypothetical protein M405DRAFT_483807 [Rhizopogon salebrosus TDB-379]
MRPELGEVLAKWDNAQDTGERCMLQNWYACASTSIGVEAGIGTGLLLGRPGRRYRKHICTNHINHSYAGLAMTCVALVWSGTTHVCIPLNARGETCSRTINRVR